MIRTNAAVFAGTLDHSSFGDTALGSACVYLTGISPPSGNAGLESVNPCFGTGLSCAPTAAASAATITNPEINERILMFASYPIATSRTARDAAAHPSESYCPFDRVLQLF